MLTLLLFQIIKLELLRFKNQNEVKKIWFKLWFSSDTIDKPTPNYHALFIPVSKYYTVIDMKTTASKKIDKINKLINEFIKIN